MLSVCKSSSENEKTVRNYLESKSKLGVGGVVGVKGHRNKNLVKREKLIALLRLEETILRKSGLWMKSKSEFLLAK